MLKFTNHPIISKDNIIVVNNHNFENYLEIVNAPAVKNSLYYSEIVDESTIGVWKLKK